VVREWLGKWQHGKGVWALLESYQESKTYNPQVVINRQQLCLVPMVRPAAHEDLAPPFDPALGGRLSEVNLLPFVSACICVEKHSGGG
jgi:hypothetical protein